MTKLFIDTNIVIDLLSERDEFYLPAAQLATLADQKKVILLTSAISLATVDYVLGEFESNSSVINKLRRFRRICGVCTTDDEIVDRALVSDFPDFEDALQYFTAIQSGCAALITRDGKGFKKSNIAVMTADEYLKSRN